MTENRFTQISIYRKQPGDAIPKIMADLRLQRSAPMSILKAKATRLLYKHATANGQPMSKWQTTRPPYPEHFRKAGDFTVIIHNLSC